MNTTAPEDILREKLTADVLRDRGKFPPAWDPQEPGDTIIGELIDVVKVQTPYGKRRVATVWVPKAGCEVTVWLSKKVLADQWDKREPEIGDHVGIAFRGEREADNGDYSYQLYSVHVERRRPADDGPADQGARQDAETAAGRTACSADIDDAGDQFVPGQGEQGPPERAADKDLMDDLDDAEDVPEDIIPY